MTALAIETRQKKWLSDLSTAIWKHLGTKQKYLRLKQANLGQRSVKNTRTAGLYIVIANTTQRGKRVELELWLDQYFRHGQLDLSYWLHFANGKDRQAILAKKHFSDDVVPISDKHRRTETIGRKAYVHLKDSQKYQEIILDKGWRDGDYLGKVWNHQFKNTDTLSKKFPVDVADFFEYILTTIAQPLDVEVTEGKRVVRKIVQIERKSKAALARKIADNFTCKICGFSFATAYPGIGDGFAEAHHKVPLAGSIKERDISPKNLVTVCANCHRMLHWGKNRSVNEVRVAFTKGKKSQRKPL